MCKDSNIFSLLVLIGREAWSNFSYQYEIVIIFEGGNPTLNKTAGDVSGGETPVPIPNTEVKSSSADGTCGAIRRESRSLPA